jgi:NADPH:quinone reductase-like Zn-dependent oxidoreductase
MRRLLRRADWDVDGVRDDLRGYVVGHLGDRGGVLIVDDTGFLKKGVRSAGVQRQYSGTAGRIENCRIGTFLAYASARGHALIDRELYLLEPWIADRDRCRAAGVPAETEFVTKPRQAMAMLARAFDAGVRFGWVTADEAYGQVKYLRVWLEEHDAAHVVSTKVNDTLITTGGREARADALIAALPARAWRRLSAGAGAHGPREYDWARLPIRIGWRAGRGHWLLARRSISEPTETPSQTGEPASTRHTEAPMKAIVATDQAAEAAGITLAERPEPTPAINDVVVEVHASGFVPAEWEWPSTWVDRSGHDRAQAIIGHELAGVVSSLGYGTTGLSLGQRVFGITDWHRDGTLAEYAAVEARNLAPLPGNVDFTVGASLPISGLTAWQGLFQHGRLQAGQSVLAHGAAGAVGSVVTQLAREFGAYVIGTGRAADRQAALDFGANEFLDLDHEDLDDIGGVDLVFDVIGGDIQRRSASIIRPGGTLVSVVGPAEARLVDGLAIDFVVESVPSQLVEIVDRVRDGRLRTHIATVATLDDAVPALNPTERRKGKTVIRVRP